MPIITTQPSGARNANPPAPAAAVVSFSVGMQGGVTAVNGLLGMVAFRTLRPHAALRSAWRLARA